MNRFLFICVLFTACSPVPLTLNLFVEENVPETTLDQITQLQIVFCPIKTGCDNIANFFVETIDLQTPLLREETITFVPDNTFQAGDQILFQVSARNQNLLGENELFGFLITTLPEKLELSKKEFLSLTLETPIQRLQDETVALESKVTVSNVFITAIQEINGGFVLFVQEPQGKTPAEHTYPAFSGLRVFIDDVLLNTDNILFDPQTFAINDCVSFSGDLFEFREATNVENIDLFIKTEGCGEFPLPLIVPSKDVSFTDIVTDIDRNTAGNQGGPKGEIFESILLTVQNVEVSALVNGEEDFDVSLPGQNERLFVDNFLFSDDLDAELGEVLPSLTGVYSQFDSFRLQPRPIDFQE